MKSEQNGRGAAHSVKGWCMTRAPVFLVPAKKTTCLTGGSEFGFSLDKKTSNATMSVGLTPHYIEKQRRYPWIIVH